MKLAVAKPPQFTKASYEIKTPLMITSSSHRRALTENRLNQIDSKLQEHNNKNE